MKLNELNFLRDRLSRVHHNKAAVAVLKGFVAETLSSLDVPKLVGSPMGIPLVELHTAQAELVMDVIPTLHESLELFWCTYEEYIVLSPVLSMYADVSVILNNLYGHLYPLNYQLGPEEAAGFADPDEIADAPLFSEDAKKVLSHYGTFKKIRDQWFVAYADEVHLPTEALVKADPSLLNETSSPADPPGGIEVSEDETWLLQIIDAIREGDWDGQTLYITSPSMALFDSEYRVRLVALQAIFPEVRMVLYHQPTEAKSTLDVSPFKDVMSRYWGYDSFRSLKIYRDVRDPENKKQTTTVSQGQIIADIIEQAEHAKSTEPYRDVFVTSSTGAGKSLMFQIPAIYLAEEYHLLTIVISPLIGLMADQVQGLQSNNITISATINSDITPANKAQIMEDVASGKVSILYISPETLLSRSDISQLIGEREVGLFVVDEAHIVTTWGKAFRSDYWYLGTYLQRLRKSRAFPVATFTATAIYGGIEDMYSETRDSLNLINPISYFGYVKRDDLDLKIKFKEDLPDIPYNDYMEMKFKILLKRLEGFIGLGQKTLVYFPLVTLITRFITYAQLYGSQALKQNLVQYFGPLGKDEKYANYVRFKSNDALIMLATKAFGMGIDIPDIHNVYHVAPTGNVCDYVQEIGRAARALTKGYAYFDYLPKDFSFVNRLHGISTVRKHQLVQVMDKIYKMAASEQFPRYLLANSDDFRHIFASKIGDEDTMDNKLKTALLIIEKDFVAKMGYSPIVARPRSLFASEYFKTDKNTASGLERSPVGHLFRKIGTTNTTDTLYDLVYSVNMKGIWESRYRSLSFAKFKYLFHGGDSALQLDFLSSLKPVLAVDLNLPHGQWASTTSLLKMKVDHLAEVFGEWARTKKYFSFEDLAELLSPIVPGNIFIRQGIATTLIQSADRFDQINKESSNIYKRFLKYDGARQKYQITNDYERLIEWLRYDSVKIGSLLQTKIDPNSAQINFWPGYRLFLPRSDKVRLEKTFLMLGILEAMGLIMYRVSGGEKPEISIRLSSMIHVKRAIDAPDQYRNLILKNVADRHEISVKVLDHVFTAELSNFQRWDLLEDYFLGNLPPGITHTDK